VFRIAQRPYRYWHRSYLATGVPKDRSIFQLDQQCYPILELCDFLDHFPSDLDFVKSLLHEETIATILSILHDRQDPVALLYSTEETPGDDAVEHPFHFSSHILLWHTFSRLARTLSVLEYASNVLNPDNLNQRAEQIRTATLQHFVALNPATRTTMFAYLTDGAGTHTFYHDANDLPTLFIPSWDFTSPSSPEYAVWTRTMKFGLSPANTEGFFPKGPYGGLGSVHTRGPWPLGFAQEFMYANLVGNRAAANDAWRRIQGSMFMDGLFSEAVDAETGECTSKAWFSWPGSVIGSALLKFGVPGEDEE
jgi:meiotically up-regulated gene 157 (Mug157) protein